MTGHDDSTVGLNIVVVIIRPPIICCVFHLADNHCCKLYSPTTNPQQNEVMAFEPECFVDSELSIGWVDPWVGLGRDFSVFRGLGWVHYSKSRCLLKI